MNGGVWSSWRTRVCLAQIEFNVDILTGSLTRNKESKSKSVLLSQCVCIIKPSKDTNAFIKIKDTTREKNPNSPGMHTHGPLNQQLESSPISYSPQHYLFPVSVAPSSHQSSHLFRISAHNHVSPNPVRVHVHEQVHSAHHV